MRTRRLIFGLCVFLLIGMLGVFALPKDASAKTTWRMQSIWVPSITLWRGDKYIVDMLNNLLPNELEIKYTEGGTLVTTSNEMFDAVRAGTLDMGTDWPSYWEGRNTAFSLVTSYPAIMNPGDYMIWLWQAGGLELCQELYAKFGIVWFPHSISGPESGQRSNKKIASLDDYKGVQMRQNGRIQAKILQDLGGAAIFLPGAEIYMAMQRGVLDAAEFAIPECDWSMGFQEISKYWILPGWHQPGPLSGIMINKKSWDKLPDNAKFTIKEGCMASMMWTWTFFEYSSGRYTRKFLEAGTEISKLDDSAMDRILQLAYDYMLEDAAANPDYAKIAFSMMRYMNEVAQWRDLQKIYTWGSNHRDLDVMLDKLTEIVKKQGTYDSLIKLEQDCIARAEKQEFWKPGTPYVQNPILVK